MTILDAIVDEIGEQETHPLADLAETLGLFIEAYEDAHLPFSDSSAPDILRTLMEEHGLTQADLPKIGSQDVVSEILSGKRDLNVRQITHLAARFRASPNLFMPDPKRPIKRPSSSRRANSKSAVTPWHFPLGSLPRTSHHIRIQRTTAYLISASSPASSSMGYMIPSGKRPCMWQPRLFSAGATGCCRQPKPSNKID